MTNIDIKNDDNIALIRTLLEKITSCEPFTSSQRHAEILRFLVEMAIEGCDIKEYTIGEKFFEGNYNIDKSDGIVRVYVYNLRKKLAEYYKNDGTDDTIEFVIPKRQYNLRFVEHTIHHISTDNKPDSPAKINRKVVLIAALATLILGVVLYLNLFNSNLYCWQNFMGKDCVNTCVIADHCVVAANIDSTKVQILHPSIRNRAAYDKLVVNGQINSRDVKFQDFGLFTKSIPISIHRLTSWFLKNNSDFDITAESELNYNLTRKSNIIYVGQFKSMSVSKDIVLSNSKHFSFQDVIITYTEDGVTHTYEPSFDIDHITEYALVSYFRLENGGTALYFMANNDIGISATIKSFTSKDFLKELYQQLPNDRCYFNLLFKVTGVQRVDTSCELVRMEILE